MEILSQATSQFLGLPWALCIEEMRQVGVHAPFSWHGARHLAVRPMAALMLGTTGPNAPRTMRVVIISVRLAGVFLSFDIRKRVKVF